MKSKERSPFRRLRSVPLVRAQAVDEPEILLYDEIGFCGITADDFRRELVGIDAATIHLRISSPGGSVFDGMAIYNALREHPARVITHIDGLAASMASVVAMAGDEVRMAESSFLMVHEPWTITIGNAEQLRKDAALLDKIGDVAASVYAAKSGASLDDVQAWMAEETWFNGGEAAAAGLVDAVENVIEEEDAAARVAALFDLSIFANTPDALRVAGSETPQEPSRRDLEHALRNAGYGRDTARDIAAQVRASQRNAAPPVAPDSHDVGAAVALIQLINRRRLNKDA